MNQGLLADKIQLIHKGYFYEAEPSTLVRAVAQGRVKAVKEIPSLGHLLIIDHGGHYYSVYSNLSKIHVKTNQIVTAKQRLGETGHRHLQMGVGLHFEIRHFSQPQDPEKWLKKRTQKLARNDRGSINE